MRCQGKIDDNELLRDDEIESISRNELAYRDSHLIGQGHLTFVIVNEQDGVNP
jgi:hypothetical protein